ncbi:MAG: nickel pincer cofactor biosynthesis protein LarB [Planctomyces sp.]|jgi:NCAIR mutase (PurE)-related protein|nr:nickel pincer cofactor biosynthesis protein LarB [Planctomyces sp.]HAV33295.1 nickel pincer cofactor biosynthesis protein LarB [Planctomycetaceae bacterium]
MAMGLPDEATLRELLGGVYSGSGQLERALAGLRSLGLQQGSVGSQMGDCDLDLLREDRCGFPEVIYGPGKPADLVVRILQRQAEYGQDSLVTRVSGEQRDAVLGAIPGAIWNSVARTIRVSRDGVGDRDCGAVLVVSAGSSDLPVAEEAAETVRWMRVPVRLIQDVGVAGPHRLLQHVAEFRRVAAIVCVAGMEAALPSVLGGYAACPVIGVPTSVGYGASLGGLTAMLSMLTCCASGVVCVNIDAGFKGGYVAGMIASRTSAASVAG